MTARAGDSRYVVDLLRSLFTVSQGTHQIADLPELEAIEPLV
ncbi:MAG: hypothetical protein WBA87_07805 [Microbacterium sp.]